MKGGVSSSLCARDPWVAVLKGLITAVTSHLAFCV